VSAEEGADAVGLSPASRWPRRRSRLALLLGGTLLIGLVGWPIPRAVAAHAPDFLPNRRPAIGVAPAAGPIAIDGELDDPGWLGAARALNFCEHSPGDQARPPVDSEAWITYDAENLYLALIAGDDASAVRAGLRDRDEIWRDDYFGIFIDTYGDHAWAYELFVNPLGIQGDLRMAGDGSEDITFDIVWKSRGRVTPQGYQVEIAIPFSSLRFPDREEQVWRVNFWRDHQREVRRRYSWAAISRDDPCWMCQWGTLTGIRGIRSGARIDVIAAAVGQQVGARPAGGGPTAPFTLEDPAGRLSASLRYGLSSCSSAELTLNPDFSQIESDVARIDVNTTFALSYPEQRPFFQEGSDLYSTWIPAVYTRSINEPDGAAKFTGTFGRTAVLYLIARDRNSPILIPGEEGSHEPLVRDGIRDLRSVSQIVRLRRMFGQQSHLGLTLTDRRFQENCGGVGTLLGVDAQIRLLGRWLLRLQALASRTTEPDDTLLTAGLNQVTFAEGAHTLGFDGETLYGHGLYAYLERESRHSIAAIEYTAASPAFRADNGYVDQNSLRRLTLVGGARGMPNRELLQGWGAFVHASRRWNSAGLLKEDWIKPEVELTLTRQIGVELGWIGSRERFAGRRFDDLTRVYLELSAQPNEVVSLSGEIDGGRALARDPARPRTADAVSAGLSASFRVLRRIDLSPRVSYYRLDERGGGANIYSGAIWRGRLKYQVSRAIAARLVVQYDTFVDRLDLEPLLTCRLNPFTVFYVGAVGHQTRYASGAGGDPDDPGDPGLPEDRWKPDARQYFAKVQFLWRI